MDVNGIWWGGRVEGGGVRVARFGVGGVWGM